MDDRQRVSSGSPFEPRIGFSRALRVGTRVLVSGTAPVWPDGSCDPDPGAQARRCFEIIFGALLEAGAQARHVVRTRMFIVDAADADAVGAAHGEVLGDVRPAATMVVTAGLLDPRWKVEIEAEAVVDLGFPAVAGDIGADRAALRRLINGYQVSQALHSIVSLGIPDALAKGQRSVDDLASETGSDAGALYRVLRALAAIGVLEEQPGRLFALTPLGDGLRSDSPMSLAGWAALIGRPHYWEAWAHLVDSVRSGENAFRAVHGTDVWTYRSTRAEEQAIFNRAMSSLSGTVAQAVVDAYDFGRFGRIVDVGGAHGTLLAAILARNPQAQGVLFDQPHVVAGAQELLDAAGVGSRCQVTGGSFFESVPGGGDAYVLKSVLHDWADAEATEILRTCLRAMGVGAVLLIVEPVVAGPNEGADVKFSDLNMLVAPGGQERTREEWESLLSGAGLALQRVTPTRGPMCVIEAVALSSL